MQRWTWASRLSSACFQCAGALPRHQAADAAAVGQAAGVSPKHQAGRCRFARLHCGTGARVLLLQGCNGACMALVGAVMPDPYILLAEGATCGHIFEPGRRLPFAT